MRSSNKLSEFFLKLSFSMVLTLSFVSCGKDSVTVPEGMVAIPEGCFQMGTNDGHQTEGPVHKVCLDAFFMDQYEVTQEAYQKVIGSNPSRFKGSNLPLETVNWGQAKGYCEKVGKRLPTEAEWEKAAKGGHDWLHPWGNEMKSGVANFCELSCEYGDDEDESKRFDDGYKTTAPVGSFSPNDYGLYDMIGNAVIKIK